MPAPVRSILSGAYIDHISLAVKHLREGGLVALPTETVYGAAGLLNQPHAVSKLRQLRAGAPSQDKSAFTIQLPEASAAQHYLGPLGELGRRCIRKLWPGPVSLVFSVSPDRQREVAAALQTPQDCLYEGETITLRCPDHPVALDVLAEIKAPVAAVKVGSDLAMDGQDIAAELDEQIVSLVLDAGQPRFSRPSTIVRVREDSYEIVRPGVYDQRIIERLLRTTILFVCSGNTCRSPMAEAIARHLIAGKLSVGAEDLEKKGVQVLSAGAMALPGSKATPAAVEALQELGVDLSQHRSKPLTVELIHQADKIYTMGRSHARAVAAMVPSAADKVETLDPAGDIEDPIGSDVSVYQHLAKELRNLIEKRLQQQPLP